MFDSKVRLTVLVLALSIFNLRASQRLILAYVEGLGGTLSPPVYRKVAAAKVN